MFLSAMLIECHTDIFVHVRRLVPLWQVLSPAGLLDAASIGLFIALQCAVYELRVRAEVGSPLAGTGAPAK